MSRTFLLSAPKTGDVVGRQLTPKHAMRVMIGDEESKGSVDSMIEPAPALLKCK
jgi:hypothetical protein